MVIRLEHIMEVRRVVSAFAAVTWSWDAAPMSNKSARVRQKPASCSVTACALLHIPHASQGYLSKQLRKRQNPCPSCAGIISSCLGLGWRRATTVPKSCLPCGELAHLPLACRLQGWHRVVCANLAHLPLACRLQGWHRVVCANLAGKDRGKAQAGNRAGKTQHCKQMGESELEWMAVTSGGMNVCHSTFLLSLGWQKAVGHMYTSHMLRRDT